MIRFPIIGCLRLLLLLAGLNAGIWTRENGENGTLDSNLIMATKENCTGENEIYYHLESYDDNDDENYFKSYSLFTYCCDNGELIRRNITTITLKETDFEGLKKKFDFNSPMRYEWPSSF